MIVRNSSVALVALLLSGCGGGGSDEQAVSANPPAAPPPVALTPSPSPSPTAALPSAVPSPVTTVPPAPAPTPPSAPGSPPPPSPPAPSISGTVLSHSLGDNYTQPQYSPWLIGSLANDPTNQVAISQRALCYGPREYQGGCGYSAASNDYQNAGIPHVPVAGSWPDGSPFVLSKTMTAGDTTLSRSSDFQVQEDRSYPLDQTIAQWDATPWFLQLQLQSDARSNTVFRLCWHYRLPNAIRLSCSKNDTLTGQIRGIYVVDDSFGLGPRTWETR